MSKEYYIASCVFTSQYPKLSFKIQRYLKEKLNIPSVRCCIPKYKLQEFTGKMPGDYRQEWSGLPDCADFQPGDTVYSVCHNCLNIIEETKPDVKIASLWELILRDDSFVYPDYSHREVIIQDCWRSKERIYEQRAVRKLAQRLNLVVIELANNYDKTNFCGNSLYRPQPIRNPKLAPLHYVANAKGKFLQHSFEEQKAIMKEYCQQFNDTTVVCYCHYCLEGLLLGGAQGQHIAELLFE